LLLPAVTIPLGTFAFHLCDGSPGQGYFLFPAIHSHPLE
jgi:hypothetical protein